MGDSEHIIDNLVYDGDDMPEDVFYGNVNTNHFEKTEALRLYNVKNVYLERDANFKELTPHEFLSKVFWRPGFEEPDLPDYLQQEDLLPFEEKLCDSYCWWLKKKYGLTKEPRPPKYSFVYNGIAQAIYGRYKHDDEKNKRYIITRLAPELEEILKNPFVIISPISYTGGRRLKQNARYLYAMAIDLDNVDAQRLDNLLFQSDPGRGVPLTFPQPNIIVNSGTGIHLYYLLDFPVPMFNDIYPVLNKIKKELTRRVWNAGTTGENPEKPQYQGNCQGFRMPGTKTKYGKTVRAFLNINPLVKPYYSIIDDLVYCGGGFLSDEEYASLKKGNYRPERITLKQAKELYPEWYERRIVNRIQTRKPWHIKRDLYDWWKQQITMKASVGHRYFCLMALAIYARKCDIPKDEAHRDILKFVSEMDRLSKSRNEADRFTKEDAEAAFKAYKAPYLTFPRDEIAAITGIAMKTNLRRYNTRQEHGRLRALRRKPGWQEHVGRKTVQDEVLTWRENHPEGRKIDCIRDTGLGKTSVYKWWDTVREKEESIVFSDTPGGEAKPMPYWQYIQAIKGRRWDSNPKDNADEPSPEKQKK